VGREYVDTATVIHAAGIGFPTMPALRNIHHARQNAWRDAGRGMTNSPRSFQT